jgi:alpha-L-fucosidase 2
MLMQSRVIAGRDESQISNLKSEIEVLPALPQAWPTGSVQGLRARGAFEVDIAWRDENLVEAAIRSLEGGSARLRYGSVTRDVTLSKGETHRWNGQSP